MRSSPGPVPRSEKGTVNFLNAHFLNFLFVFRLIDRLIDSRFMSRT